MTKAGERLIKAAKEAAELARTPPAKREWVEWRLCTDYPRSMDGFVFKTAKLAKDHQEIFFSTEIPIIKTRVTVIE